MLLGGAVHDCASSHTSTNAVMRMSRRSDRRTTAPSIRLLFVHIHASTRSRAHTASVATIIGHWRRLGDVDDIV